MSTKKVLSVLKLNLPWVLLSLTALIQIEQQTSGLTPWRGGGYGMYSTHHPNRRLIGIKNNHFEPLRFDKLKSSADCQSLKRLETIKRYPTRSRLKALKRCLTTEYKDAPLTVFEPTFNPASGKYAYREINVNR